MLPYTDAEKAVIKSNLHIGNNRPLAAVTIGGIKVPVTSFILEPIKNGAGKATLKIDNTSGHYAPDKQGPFYHVIWPNAEVKISVGYGDSIEAVFDGLIDSIEIKTWRRQITVYARDMTKRALDQTVTDDTGLRTLTYIGMPLEYIFKDLARRAGWAAESIHCDTSGITTSATFTHVTYADAFQQLADLYNYEYFAGRNGEIYFHYVTDRQPERTDQAVKLSGTTAAALEKYPIVTASIRVYSGTGYGGTKYAAGTDYVITPGSKDTAWMIRRIDGGGIPSGATVYVSYVWAAWVFSEGKDIISLGYTIDDSDLYRTVTVLGKTSADMVCHGNAVYANADYYGVLNNKVLIIEDDTAATAAAAEVVAKRVMVTQSAGVREVEFEAVGNPYLWVGDCIMVLETSSTISEIYRISDLKYTFDPDAAPIFGMSITARYYGYAPA